jgi:hypothetical protein
MLGPRPQFRNPRQYFSAARITPWLIAEVIDGEVEDLKFPAQIGKLRYLGGFLVFLGDGLSKRCREFPTVVIAAAESPAVLEMPDVTDCGYDEQPAILAAGPSPHFPHF